MLAKICLKRFRFPLYALFFTVFCYHFAETLDSGALYAVFLLVFLPIFAITSIWAIYTAIRDILRYPKYGLPYDPPTYAERIIWRIQDECEAVKALSLQGRKRYLLFRIFGVALILGGLAAIIKNILIAGTLLLIAGVAFWQSALPKPAEPKQDD